MPAIPPLPELAVPDAYRTTVESWQRFTGSLRLHGQGTEAAVQVERCAAGRLQGAYPAGAHDVEVRIESEVRGDVLTTLLRTLVGAVRAADARCRRIVYAVDEGGVEKIEAAEAAGFRYVVDVDVQDLELSLLVAEPSWVTATDMDLDLAHVPGT
ncbi:hypothetical protein [Streptomyces jumonjinensis]|uniref:GNAT family N-acetyltransferase n=1 Tax=Streptomyces jumonjinensis TaxID=1945 RepID=A0A646KIK5_STRJU|nr:hypothetical protein [Streptomyces jumonjinensis]MQT02043.1 hypothetical protein [Streptomyces jumonjinensis]